MSTESQSTSMNPPESKYIFKEPQKLIKSAMDMAKWEKSEAYFDLLGFLNSICMIIQGRSLNYKCQISPAVQKLLDMLGMFEKLAIETPPIE